MPAPHTPGDDRAPDPADRNEVLDRFEAAWRQGRPPAVEDALPDDPALRRAALPHLVHIDLERRLKAGQGARARDYFDRFPELAEDKALALSLIAAECRWRRGAAVPLEEYVRQFPEYRDELPARLLPLLGDRPTPHAEPPAPERVGRYRVLRRLGAGAMGVVYLAHDPVLDRDVALKLPRVPPDAPHLAERFVREGRAAARLHHPNICPVYDAGESDGTPYLAMRYVAGAPLTAALPPPLPPRQAADVVRRLALAVQGAHDQGVVHRDIKPANVLVPDGGYEPVLTDFGLARRLADDTRATEPGVVLGAPGYMAPEQARGDPDAVGPLSDVYSLGVVLYELLTGRLPFEGPSHAVLDQVAHAEPPPPSQFRPGLDRALEGAVLRALAKRPEDRFASMAAFADALAGWLEDRPPEPARPAAPPAPAEDPRASAEALALLRQWGWELGLARLKADLSAAEPSRRAALQVLLGWLAGERGHHAEAAEQFAAVAGPLAGWALAGRAFLALRERRFADARDLLTRADAAAAPEDRALRATVAHVRGTALYHQGRDGEALAHLHDALEQFGPAHFGTGRVLDTLGMVHATRNNFPAACEFFAAALDAKRRAGDDAGVALTHGQLGRLHLEWGDLDRADEHFRTGIELARQAGDERGEAQQQNHRGQVLLARGRPADALPWLDESARRAAGRWPILEGYARKDRALACLRLGRLAEADAECDRAEARFQAASFAEGLFHARLVRGLLRREQGRAEEAVRCLRAAAAHFEHSGEHAEAARALAELARALRAAGAPAALAAEALLAALAAAEEGRRGPLASALEEEWRGLAAQGPEGRPAGRRGAAAAEGQAGWPNGREGPASAVAVEVRGGPAGASLAEAVGARNHLYADLAAALRDGPECFVQYRGDGFVAVLFGRDRAPRAVAGATAVVRLLAELNRPRRVLGWPPWEAHAGVSSGAVYLGGVGTCRRWDFAAAGPAVALAAALCAEAAADRLLLDEATWRLAPPPGARPVAVRGRGAEPQQAWEAGPEGPATG